MVAEPSRSTMSSTAGMLNWGTTGTEPSAIVHDLLPHINPDSTSRQGTLDESLATYAASPDKPEGIREDATGDEGIVKML